MRLMQAALGMLLIGASALWAEEVEIPETPAAAQDPWDGVEEWRGTTLMAKALDDLLRAHPHGELAARARIEQASGQEDLAEAARLLRLARAENPSGEQGARAAYELSRLEFLQGHVEAAILALQDGEAAKRSAELEADWLYQRGQCRLAVEDFARARADFEAFLKGHPEHPQAASAALGVAECLTGEHKDEEAGRAFDAIYTVKGSDFAAQALWGAATIRQRQKRMPEAKALLSRLQAEYPASFEAQAAKARLNSPSMAAVKSLPRPRTKTRSYSVRVGAYSFSAGAEKAARSLKAKGYSARVEKTGSTQAPYLVKVGSYKTRQEALSMGTRYSKREKQGYLIVEE